MSDQVDREEMRRIFSALRNLDCKEYGHIAGADPWTVRFKLTTDSARYEVHSWAEFTEALASAAERGLLLSRGAMR